MKTIQRRGVGAGLAMLAAGCFGAGWPADGRAAETGAAEGNTVWLAELDLAQMSAGWGVPRADRSIQEKPLTLAGRRFERGVGTHAESELTVDLKGKGRSFRAVVGVDDEVGETRGTVVFRLLGDGKELWTSGVMKAGDPPKEARVDLAGVAFLRLEAGAAGDGIDFDHADWAEARFEMEPGAKPAAAIPPPPPREDPVLLTPPPPREPRINGPSVYGCRPGKPFLYRIPATGDRPMAFAVDGLPGSFHLDVETGILSGASPLEPGRYEVRLRAKNARGAAERPFAIVVGDTLALTPPMGWNDWYTFYDRPTDALMRQAADILVASGMADHGYQYVNIDDCWMNRPNAKDPALGGPARDAEGRINANGRFPDMKAMTDYIHAKGLKAGLYTSPGPLTCAGFYGSHQYEAQDARRFAEWGFDFLKHDWCSYGRVAKKTEGEGLEYYKKPYRLMGDLLKQQDRDIVFNLCQYGMGEVWTWGAEVGGHCWRTTGDLGLEKGKRLPGFYSIGFKNAKLWEHARPGAWNDPDYILIGFVGNAHNMSEPAKPTPLTPHEQYSYMTMWCLMAAPLFYSGDITRLDEFTLNVLCNAEVIEVDQDPLGKQARIVRKTDEELVLAKPMADGSLAVGLFNLAEEPRTIEAAWPDLAVKGHQRVRDLWRWKDLGVAEGAFRAEVPRHGVALVRLWPDKGE